MDTEIEAYGAGFGLNEPRTELAEESDSTGEMTINETAKFYGITLRTLRFYEDRGLICPRQLDKSRFYSAADRARIQMILKGKRFGFTLTEISSLIGASGQKGAIVPDLESRLKPSQISAQLAHLERQRREMDIAITELCSICKSDE